MLFDPGPSRASSRRSCTKSWLAGLVLSALLGGPATAQDVEPRIPGFNDGILPSLSAFLPPSSPLALRFPEEQAGANRTYERRFPLGGQAAVDRGATLPEPWGVSLSYIDNEQAQDIEDLSVALGKGAPPPSDTDLVDLPFVSIDDASSRTYTRQIRADLWVLPFLNVFGGLGKVTGSVPLNVVVDLDETGLCPPVATCGTLSAPFIAGVDTNTATVGLTGAYGWDNWFVTASASGTASFGGDTEDAVRSYSVSGRFGRRWAFGPGHIVSPYIGASYLNLDQIVEGTTRLPDAFPDGDSLDVRYRAKISNPNKWSGVVGLNLGFIQGFALSGEYNFNEQDSRTVLSGTYRF